MRRIACLLVLVTFAACTTDVDESTRPDKIAGTYHLATMGGAPLPVPTRIDTTSFQVQAGELVMTAGGTWTESLDVTTLSPTGVQQAFKSTGEGTWVILRDQAYIAFMDRRNAYSFSGVGSGSMIVLQTKGGQQMVYRR